MCDAAAPVFVEPGIYGSPVTRHYPPMPHGPVGRTYLPIIIVGQDQSRTYDYYDVPPWSGQPILPPFPAPID